MRQRLALERALLHQPAAAAARRAVHRARSDLERRAGRTAEGPERPGLSDSASPPTISTSPKTSCRDRSFSSGGRLVPDPGRGDLRTPVSAGDGAVMKRFPPRRVARRAEGSHRRDPQLRDSLDDAVLRRDRRARVLVRAGARTGAPLDDVAAAILWIAIAFSGTLALGRTFERERQNETLRALLLAPADRPALYAGKLLGIAAAAGARRSCCWCCSSGCSSRRRIFARPWLSLALLVTGTLGFASVGTLFAAMLVRARSRDVLLPILLYPITVPVMIAGVRGTAALFQPEPDTALAQFWLALLCFLRCGVRHAGAVDVRTVDDGLRGLRLEVRAYVMRNATRSARGDGRRDVCRGAVDYQRRAARVHDGARAEDFLLPLPVGDHVPARRARGRRSTAPSSCFGKNPVSGLEGAGRGGADARRSACSRWSPVRSGRARRGACGGSGTRGSRRAC